MKGIDKHILKDIGKKLEKVSKEEIDPRETLSKIPVEKIKKLNKALEPLAEKGINQLTDKEEERLVEIFEEIEEEESED